MEFHIIYRKSELIDKNIPIVLLVDRVCKVEDILKPISDHMLTELILIGFDDESQIFFSRNSFEPNKS